MEISKAIACQACFGFPKPMRMHQLGPGCYSSWGLVDINTFLHTLISVHLLKTQKLYNFHEGKKSKYDFLVKVITSKYAKTDELGQMSKRCGLHLIQ